MESDIAFHGGLSVFQGPVIMRSLSCLVMVALACVHLTEGASEPGPVEGGSLTDWRACLAESGRLYEEGRFNEAERVLSKAVHYAEQFAELDHRLPTTIHALGFLYQEQCKYAEAKACYLRAIHLWQRIGPTQHDALSKSIDNLIGTYMENHEYRAAEKLMAYRLPEMEQSVNWEDRATLLNMRGALALRKRRYGEAEREYQQSLALWEEHAGGEDKNITSVLLNLSQLYETTKRYQQALDVGTRAATILERSDPTVRPFLARALDNVAFILVKLSRYSDAERFYYRALDIAREVFGPDHPFSGQIMLSYSGVLRKLKQKRQAEALVNEAQAILCRSKQPRETVDIFEMKVVAGQR
jgi:tetratricopeptide (TPR) repeat protein